MRQRPVSESSSEQSGTGLLHFKKISKGLNQNVKIICLAKLRITSGIYEVFLERSGRKIWVKPELRAEPYIPCYTPRAKRSGARAQRGATERSEFKKYFSFNRILIGFFFNLNKFVFVLGEGQRGIKGVNARSPKLLIFRSNVKIFFQS